MKNKWWSELCAESGKDYIKAEVWGREAVFEKSVLPTSMKIKGEEILYAPVCLHACFGDAEGVWSQQQVIQLDADSEKAEYSVTQTAENLIVNAKVKIEFDGFIRIDLSAVPFWAFHKDNKPRLTKLSIDIPVKNEFSTLMHYWPNCESGVCLSSKVLNSHATPNGETKLAFKPYLWTGWEYGGIGICCESDRGFELDNPDECITITRNDEYTNIHIALLDHMPEDWSGRTDEWGNTIRPIMYSFGIQTTPVKEFQQDNLREWRAFHLYDVPKHPIFEKVRGNGDTMLERIAQSGAKWLILHEDWTVIQNWGLPENEEQFKAFVKDCHDLGMKLMVYFGYEVSTLYPDFADKCDEYLNKNTQGNFVGGWQRPPMQRDFTVCYNGGYSDVMIERVKHVMDEYGVDGIYTDGTYVPWECANEAHGCGYRDKNGELKFIYPIFAVREHVKKLYQAVHERGGVIDTHQSSCCMMAALGFADSYFDGENIQGMLAEDISRLKMDTFRAEFMGLNMGIPCNFISYTSNNFTLRKIAGITLIHNVYPRANRISDLDCASSLWKSFGDFASSGAEWVPYWENNDIKADNDKTCISYYKKENKTLLVICCLDDGMQRLSVKLDKNYSQAEDLLDGECCVLDDGRVDVSARYVDVKLIELTV